MEAEGRRKREKDEDSRKIKEKKGRKGLISVSCLSKVDKQ